MTLLALTFLTLGWKTWGHVVQNPGGLRGEPDGGSGPPASGRGIGAERDRDAAEWERILGEETPAPDRLAARDALAKRQAEAATALLRSGQSERVWPLMRHGPDPSLRSYLVRDLARSGTSPDAIVQRLDVESDLSARRALILSLGGFTGDQLPADRRKPLIAQLLRLYRMDPDPGAHSAVDWLLRHGRQGLADRKLDWQQGDALRAIDRDLAGQTPKGRNWFITKQGHTLAVVHGPVEFTMGAPRYEPGRDKINDEALHRVRIPRSFAVATKELTVGQFQRFLDANPEVKKRARTAGQKDPAREGPIMRRLTLDDECPQILMTWFEAAQYCNWLSQQEGIPEEEWCYPALDQVKEGMKLPQGHLRRTGYRLPTEAEWEYACRAGASTSRFYGSSEELLPEYAWYTGTTFNERPWPVGQLKPNDLGLFDVYGNVWEWGHDRSKRYPAEPDDRVRDDSEDAILTVSREQPRPRRGGSFTYEAEFMRSAHRGSNPGYIPDERRDSVGFRVARTVR
jgi:formylglycine-generating enzyme required for sulfatase activity